METLGKLFGSEAKVKIMKLFLFNSGQVFTPKEIAERVKEKTSKVRREMTQLEKMHFVRRRSVSRRGKSTHGYIMDPKFTYLSSLQSFLVNVEPLNSKEIIKKVSRLGNIKLIITAGVFIQEAESRADILIVGDNVKRASLEKTIQNLESEIGKELRYAYFTTEDFKYRLNMYDKLARDILDYPHRKVLNKLGIS